MIIRLLARRAKVLVLSPLLNLALLIGFLLAGCATSKPLRVVEISPGIFEGSKPRTQAHFDTLKSQGVKSILSLQQRHWDIWPERRKARRNGLEYRNVMIPAIPFEPPKQSVKVALLTLHDPSLRPIYVHCFLGKDRNAFLIGLYRIYFQDWIPEAAWEEMIRLGFHDSWRLHGFKTYFWKHSQKPDWVKVLRAHSETKPP